MVRERLPVLGAIGDLVDFLFVDELEPDPALPGPEALGRGDCTLRACWRPATRSRTPAPPSFTRPTELEPALRGLAEARGWKAGDLFMAIRVAITGRTATPPLFETMVALGRARAWPASRRAAALAAPAQGGRS